MNRASSPLTQFQEECIELTTRNKISLACKTKFTTPSRDIIIQEKIRQSEKQQGRQKRTNVTSHKKSIQQQIVRGQNRGLNETKLIGIFVCLVFLSLLGQSTAAINCRFPRNLEFLCPRPQKLQIHSKSSVPTSNVEKGLTIAENPNASPLSSSHKSPIDPKTSFSSNISGGKRQTTLSSLFPLKKTIRNNDEHERNFIKQSKDKAIHVPSKIALEEYATEKHSQDSFNNFKNLKPIFKENQDQSSKRVSRSIKYFKSPKNGNLNYIGDPCRRFVFAPACRGVTSKRSNGPGVGGAPKSILSADPSIFLNTQSTPDNLIDDGEDSQEEVSLEQIPEAESVREPKGYGKTKRSPTDEGNVPLDLEKRERGLGSFSSFYSPLSKRSGNDPLGSFSSFYSKRDSIGDKRAPALDSFSSFYSLGKRGEDNALLDSFSSFYAPAKRSSSENNQEKRFGEDALDSFSSFYAPHNKRSRDMLDSFSSFYGSSKKRNALDSFSSFYGPSKKRNALDSFSSFYGPSKRNGRNDILGSFSSFYGPHDKRNNDLLDSFSSFYGPSKRGATKKDGNKGALGSFSSFYMPQKKSDYYGKREDVFQPFSSFYAPSQKRSVSNSLKRNDVLDSFSSFYGPSKRNLYSGDDIGSFSSFYSPTNKRSYIGVIPHTATIDYAKRSPLTNIGLVLDPFSSFYGPSKRSKNVKRRDVLRSFHSFYNPL